MSEHSMWGMLRRPMMQAGLDPIRVENPARSGTPDVNYTQGWIELKWAKHWPIRGGPLRVDHFTRQQRIWHTRRRRAGGRSYVMLQVGQEWLLLDGWKAAKELGFSTRDQLRAMAIAMWEGGAPDQGSLKRWLTD